MAKRLSAKSSSILSLIADGQSYSQIVENHAGVTYLDVFGAAREALDLIAGSNDGPSRMELSKAAHKNAYKSWTAEEDADLQAMHEAGKSVAALAVVFERGPGAITSRLQKLGLE